MDYDLETIRPELTSRISEALLSKILTNRGTLPPFRLPEIARTIVTGLFGYLNAAQLAQEIGSDQTTEADQTGTKEIGQAISLHGLSIASLLEAFHAATLLTIRRFPGAEAPIQHLNSFFSSLIQEAAKTEQEEIERQRSDMERAYMTLLTRQNEEQELLRSTISELSTPIIPVYEGIIVLPLVGSIDSRRSSEITERLLEEIANQQAMVVIIDITGVPVMDTITTNHLLMTTRAANLLGSQVIFVGIGAEIAQTMVSLSIDLHGVVILSDLQAGLAYALKQFDLAIQPV